ncbi:hypothetical protein JYB87_01955 [Shewanella avicenniae]|uniref:Uncharacterized protein n=1 Tax=Shewanella avicenniae TaxID=2814294 RepID=A0ABX7QTP2_9GAMM|nr:hypothetical protein [Shewanella avicenniae]QSX34041.1 hypothetical protein JYB87_01955 [Shewanella avicenniae]
MDVKFAAFIPNMKTVAVTITAAGVVVSAAFSVQQWVIDDQSLVGNCTTRNEYNTALPANHPSNRCANPQQELSWRSWLSGKSRSGQFHFIDFMELLSGHQRKPIDDVSPRNSGRSTQS